MGEEIKKFDVNEAMQAVKGKIKDAFVSLIPDEQWDAMVKKEVDTYFKETEYNSGYGGNKIYQSDFGRDVSAMLRIEVNERVKEYLTKNFQTTWYDNGVPICNALIEKMITDNAGKVLTNLIGGTLQMALNQAGYSIKVV